MSKVPTEIGSLARAYTERGIQILGGIAETGDTDAARIAAIKLLFDRGYGAVAQEVKHTGTAEDGAHEIIVRHIQEGAIAPKR